MPSDPIARRLLVALCLMEFLERLAGYFVAASLVLYLNESRHLPIGDATSICGWILGLSYEAAVGGGTLLDCCLGARRQPSSVWASCSWRSAACIPRLRFLFVSSAACS